MAIELSFFSDYIVLVIVGICACVGYVIKTSITIIPNKYIPLIMLVLGTIISVLMNLSHITANVVLQGMVSGLGSTGAYEMVHQFIKNLGNEKGFDESDGIEGINGDDDD